MEGPTRESIDRALGSLTSVDNIVLKRLGDNGKAWIVGGWVRDSLSGGSPGDMDIATTLNPEQIKSIFPKSLMVGASFGTVIVRLDDDLGDGSEWQVTTLRSEGEYSDGRRPGKVSFLEGGEENSGIIADLGRRDFTINSMAIDAEGGFLDPHGGLNDLESGVLKSVGDAKERFKEDGLRVLRAFRFLDGGRMGIREMDDSLRNGILSSEEFLSGISRERVGMEMSKILSGENTHSIASQMLSLGVLSRVFEDLPLDLPPELSTKYLVNLALLLRGSELSGEMLSARLRDLLVLSKNDLLEVSIMHECRNMILDSSIESSRRFTAAVPDERKEMLLDYLQKSGTDTEDFVKSIEDINGHGLHLDPLVKGARLVSVTGLQPGPRLGRLKGWLHRRQIEEASKSEEEVLEFLSDIDWELSDYREWEPLSWP